MNQLRHNFSHFLGGVFLLVAVLFSMNQMTTHALAGTLSCSVATSGACTSGVVIYRMSGSSNAHAELGNQTTSNYNNNVVCCTNVIGLGNSCAATTTAIALKLSSTTNAHAEQNSQSNFLNPACISTPMSGAVTVGYQANNCSGFDTTLGSMISATNSHVGNPAAYTTKICASASSTPQTISFSISNNIIGFGALSAVQTRYASADTNGTTSTSTDAHTISIASNASGGYSLTINGTTLTCSSCTNGATIAAIGSSPVAPSVGIEQFGMRITRNSGTGTTTAPYNTTNWALDTAAFPGTVVTGTGDSNTSVFGVKYMTSIATISEAGVYNALITYTVTSSF